MSYLLGHRGKGNEARPMNLKGDKMESISDLTYEIAAKIAAKIGGKVSMSNQSASVYVTADLGEGEWVCRISDHEAMSYNRIGDFNIQVGSRQCHNAQIYVPADYIEEEIEREDIDSFGDPVKYTHTENNFEYDVGAMNDAILSAIADFMEEKAK